MENPNKIQDDVIQGKKDSLAQSSEFKQSLLDAISQEKQQSLNPVQDFLQTAREVGRKDKLQRESFNYSDTDYVTDVASAVGRGTVNLAGGLVGGGALIQADPVQALTNAVDTVGEAVSDFTGTDTLRGAGESIRATFQEAEQNVRQFYKDNGLDWINDASDVIQGVNEQRTNIAEAVGTSVLDATKIVSDNISKLDSEATKARKQLRAQENQEKAAKIKAELGEDASVFETAYANTKIGYNAATELLSDPASLSVVVAESIPSLAGSAIAAKVATKGAYKNAQTKFATELRESGMNADDLKIAINTKVEEAVNAIGSKAAVTSGALFEAAGTTSETYNLIMDTKIDTLAKTSDRFKELVKTMSPEEAQKQLAIESAQGAGLAMMAAAIGIGKLSGVGEGISRTAGVARTKDGLVPRAWEVSKDALKEGIEETAQSFTSATITGIEERQNVDKTVDVYQKAAIAAGEGAIAGVGMSVAGSAVRTSSDLLNYTADKAQQKISSELGNSETVKDIRDNGLNREALNTSSGDFDYISTMRGIQARTKKLKVSEDVNPQEAEYIIEEAKNVSAEFAARIEQAELTLQEGLKTGEITPQEAEQVNKQLDADRQSYEKGTNYLAALVYEQRERIGSDIEGDVEKAVTNGDTKATERVFGNMRNDINSVTVKQAEKLLTSENLTEEQTKEAEAFIELKKIAEVNSDVLIGSKGFIGLQQYLNSVSANINLGRQDKAQEALDMLSTFAQRHTQKALDYDEAYSIALLGNKATPEQVQRKAAIEASYPKLDGEPISIHANSSKLINIVQQEANALAAGVTLAEAQLVEAKPSVQTNPQEQPQVASVEEQTTQTNLDTKDVFNDVPWENDISAKEVLNSVINSKDLKPYSSFTKLVQDSLNDDVKVTMVPSTSDKLINHSDTEKALGTYDAVTKTIYVSNNIEQDALRNEVIFHEILHSIMWDALDSSNKAPDAKQKQFRKEANALFTRVRNQARKDGRYDEFSYALNDIQEFAVMGTSNPSFMQYLNTVKVGNKSALSKFVEYISKLVGKNIPEIVSALEKLLESSVNFISKDNTKLQEPEVTETTEVPERTLEERTVREATQGELFDAPPLASTTEAVQEVEPTVTEEVTEAPVQQELDLFNFAEQVTTPETETELVLDDNRDFYSENLVANNFKRATRGGFSTNPIVANQDPLGSIGSNPSEFITKNSTIEEVSAKQANLVSDVGTFHNEVKESLNKIFQVSQRKNLDMISYFADENGQLPENVIAAMSVVAYDWLSTKGGNSLYNSDETIREMANLDKDDYVTPEIREAYQQGSVRSAVAETIGAKVVKALGITPKSTAPSNMKPQLENSLGQWTIATLMNQGLLTNEAVPNFKSEDPNSVINMVTVASVPGENGYPNLAPEVERFSDNFKDSKGVLDKVFGVESFDKGPTFEPTKRRPNKVKGTNQDISKEIDDAIRNENNRKYRMKKEQLAVFNSMSTDAKRKMLGYKDVDNANVFNRDGYEGINRAINKGIKDIEDFTGSLDDLETAFYFSFYTIKNGRVMIDSNTVNPLINKLHRHLMVKEGQEHTVNDKASEDEFLIAFAQSMGVKIDKQLIEVSLQQIRELAETKVVKDAVTLLRTHDSLDQFTPEQEAVLLEAIDKGGEKTWSLDGLVAYAGYLNAKELGVPFTHDLAVEVDGVTNGPAIGTWQFGIGNSLSDVIKRLKQISINVNGDIEEYGAHASKPTYRDNYETITQEVDNAVQNLDIKDSEKAVLNILFGGDLVQINEEGQAKINRNISKNPLMTTIYGASEESIKNTLSDAAIKEFHKILESQDSGKIDPMLDAMLASGIIDKEGYKAFQDNHLEAQLDNNEIRALKELVDNTYGDAMNTAIETVYGDFQEKTKVVNGMMDVVATTFGEMFTDAVQRRTQELANQGFLAKSKNGTILEDLPQSELDTILEELLEAQPIMQSVFSSRAGDITKEGLYVGKINREQQVDNIAYQTRSNPKGMSELTMFGSKDKYVTGGVAPVVLAVQNIDAATMMSHIKKYNSKNVHDAVIVGAGKVVERAKDMNKNFTEINMEHSIASEAFKAFTRAAKFAAKYDAENGTNYARRFEVTNEVGETSRDRYFSAVGQINTDKTRNQSIITGVSQYYWEGARHNVSLKPVNFIDEAVKLAQFGESAETATENSDRTFGSSPNSDGNTNKSDIQKQVDKYTASQVFEELGKVGNKQENPVHAKHLRDSINLLKAKLTEPVKLKLTQQLGDTVANIQGEDIYMYTQLTGSDKGSTAILNSGLRMSAQEAFTHELWHSVSRQGIDEASRDKAELENVWERAREYITPRDLMDDPSHGQQSPEYQEALDTWNYIFTPRVDYVKETVNVAGKTVTRKYSNHLHEFSAYAMTNEKFIKALKNVPLKRKAKPQVEEQADNALESVWNWVKDKMFSLMDMFSQQVTNTRGVSTDFAVQRLVMNISNIEAQHKNLLVTLTEKATTGYDVLSNLVGSAGSTITKPLVKFANSKMVKDSGNVLVRLPGRTVRLASKAKYVGLAADYLLQVRQRNETTKQKMLEHIMSEARGLNGTNKVAHTLVNLRKKFVDGATVETETATKKILNNVFEDQPLTESQQVAITKALLKTDLTSLNLNLNSLVQLVSDPKVLDNTINKLVNNIKNDKFFGHYDVQTKALGWYMVTGEVKADNMNFNAKQIANLYGLNMTNENAKAHEATLDQLATLYALKYTPESYKNELADVMKTSLSKGPDNGMSALIELHRNMKKDDLENRFKGSETNVMKGYVQDDLDPNVETMIATVDEGEELEKRGWVKHYDLPKDGDDVTQTPRALYVNRFGGKTSWLSAALSLTNTKAAGSDTIQIERSNGSLTPRATGMRKARRIARIKMVKARKHLKNQGNFDPSKEESLMAPLYDLNGKVTGYRYMMTEKTKDTVLQRNNNSFDVLAKQAGRSVNVVNSMELNNKAIEALKEQYDATKENGGFINVSSTSVDPEMREIYQMLPDATKLHIRSVWGTDGMFVNREVFTIIFGYRKYSLADAMEQSRDQQSLLVQALSYSMNFLTAPFNVTGSQVVRVVGNEWQEYVKTFKDFLIVKSGFVTVINSLSNTTQLMFSGLSIKDTIRYQKEAYVEAFRYRRDMTELRELEKMVEIGYKSYNLKEQQSRIAELQNRIATNPTSQLIEDGLLQTIVEDIDLVESDSRVQSLTEQKLGKYISKLPGFVRKGASELFMTHDSKMYKLASEAAQLSDFVSRYALYQHNTKNGMGHTDAINESMDQFVNYNIPTHRSLQYANDMGFVWFSTYFIRIQRILAKHLIENPNRVLTALLLNMMSGGMLPTMYDSVISPENISNRVMLPGSPDELISNLGTLQPI